MQVGEETKAKRMKHLGKSQKGTSYQLFPGSGYIFPGEQKPTLLIGIIHGTFLIKILRCYQISEIKKAIHSERSVKYMMAKLHQFLNRSKHIEFWCYLGQRKVKPEMRVLKNAIGRTLQRDRLRTWFHLFYLFYSELTEVVKCKLHRGIFCYGLQGSDCAFLLLYQLVIGCNSFRRTPFLVIFQESNFNCP